MFARPLRRRFSSTSEAVVALAKDLIARPSVTPTDAGCQEAISTRLQQSDFRVQNLPSKDVSNMFAEFGDPSGPTVLFLGHTDVVPPGESASWRTPPFEPTLVGYDLFGRGACDMKGNLAAMTIALEQFAKKHQGTQLLGRACLLVTSDEEGPAEHGTRAALRQLKASGQHFDYCLVGEPSSEESFGDRIRVGRRGSLYGAMRVYGQQGHTAYPSHSNPLHGAVPVLNKMIEEQWCQGCGPFEPTTFQISECVGISNARNVTSEEVNTFFNWRFSPATSVDLIQDRLGQLIHEVDVDIEVDTSFTENAQPFACIPDSPLQVAVIAALKEHAGITPELDTGGGTSDGRFFAEIMGEKRSLSSLYGYSPPPASTPTTKAAAKLASTLSVGHVVELGPSNRTIHAVNERVDVRQLEVAVRVYVGVLEKLLLPKKK